MKLTAKMGSTPEDEFAIMEMVPVGAMVVVVALRMKGVSSLSNSESW